MTDRLRKHLHNHHTSDNQGYANLTELISRSYLRPRIHNKPVVDQAWLAECNAGLLLLSGGREGDLGIALLKDNSAQAERCLDFYQQHFTGRYYLELLRTGRPDEERYLHLAVALASAQGLPVVASNEVAVALWLKLGFAIVGRVPLAYRHREHGLVDILVMHKPLA